MSIILLLYLILRTRINNPGTQKSGNHDFSESGFFESGFPVFDTKIVMEYIKFAIYKLIDIDIAVVISTE